MRLILTQEVTGLGGPGDVVEVKDGYGRNFLVPRGLAIQATRGAEKQITQIRRAREVREIRDLGQAQQVANDLRSVPVTLNGRAGQGGRLFGSVTAADVAAAVVKAGGPKLDRRRIELPTPIKSVGTHKVMVRLHPEVVADLNIQVVAD
ncbi:MAG: large subunit ribosomal protein [Frankiaceae bacterium]|jgi:large subunit ribosomal protein L9|nr:large subunit ribosomal protein [Frankiaceae bacterium]MDQ1650036.1 large subunit ribosomal protein [Frankiaceae bacterium]